jgi:hypothetical protein
MNLPSYLKLKSFPMLMPRKFLYNFFVSPLPFLSLFLHFILSVIVALCTQTSERYAAAQQIDSRKRKKKKRREKIQIPARFYDACSSFYSLNCLKVIFGLVFKVKAHF